MSYSYNLSDITDGTMFQGIVKKDKNGRIISPAAPAEQKTTSSTSTKEKLLSAGGKVIDIASSFARKQELQAEAAAKLAETQRINAAGSNIEKYILPIAIGGAALIGIIYFARKK